MTPAQFAACSRMVDNERKQMDMQLSWIRVLLAEPNRDTKKRPRPFTIPDMSCMPEAAAEATKRREQSPEQMQSYVVNVLNPWFKGLNEQRKKKGGLN